MQPLVQNRFPTKQPIPSGVKPHVVEGSNGATTRLWQDVRGSSGVPWQTNKGARSQSLRPYVSAQPRSHRSAWPVKTM